MYLLIYTHFYFIVVYKHDFNLILYKGLNAAEFRDFIYVKVIAKYTRTLISRE